MESKLTKNNGFLCIGKRTLNLKQRKANQTNMHVVTPSYSDGNLPYFPPSCRVFMFYEV